MHLVLHVVTFVEIKQGVILGLHLIKVALQSL